MHMDLEIVDGGKQVVSYSDMAEDSRNIQNIVAIDSLDMPNPNDDFSHDLHGEHKRRRANAALVDSSGSNTKSRSGHFYR